MFLLVVFCFGLGFCGFFVFVVGFCGFLFVYFCCCSCFSQEYHVQAKTT